METIGVIIGVIWGLGFILVVLLPGSGIYAREMW